jgi:hypothetical protein
MDMWQNHVHVVGAVKTSRREVIEAARANVVFQTREHDNVPVIMASRNLSSKHCF